MDSALLFARPSMFDDPFECRIPPSFEADAPTIERFWRNKWARQGRPPRSQEELDGLIAKSGTKEGRQQLMKVYFDLLDTYGLARFAPRANDFLLWSYYAASHSGVAVRFDTGDDILEQIPKPYLPLKVDYARDFKSIAV